MTGQPAVYICFLLFVAFDTYPHPPLFVRQPLNVLNLTVAFLAGNFAVDVPLVIEQDMLGHIIYFHPGGRGLGVEIFVLFLDLRMFFNNIIMAVQTLFHRRDTRKVRVSDIGVTVLALNLFDATVDIMTERYRLLRSKSGRRRSPEIIYKGRHKEYGD